jgi:hypothetical protein
MRWVRQGAPAVETKGESAMYYTIISKSAWQGDCWAIVDTYPNKQTAHDEATKLRNRTDARSNFYNVKVKAHRKELHELMDRNERIVFSDGTWAVPNW